MGNNVLCKYNEERVVCPLSLKEEVFTTAALDNTDHNPSSTTLKIRFMALILH